MSKESTIRARKITISKLRKHAQYPNEPMDAILKRAEKALAKAAKLGEAA